MRDIHANLQPTSTVYVGVDLHRRRWHVTARTAEAELFSASIEGTWEALRRRTARQTSNGSCRSGGGLRR